MNSLEQILIKTEVVSDDDETSAKEVEASVDVGDCAITSECMLELKVEEADSETVTVSQVESNVEVKEDVRTCLGCRYSLFDMLALVEDEARLISFLQLHNVILKELRCYTCGNPCTFYSGRRAFRCQKSWTRANATKKRCNTSRSFATGSWFECCSLPLDTICKLCVYVLVLPPPRGPVVHVELSLTSNSTVAWSDYIHGIFLAWAKKQQCESVGGVGKLVEIDEVRLGKKDVVDGRLQGEWLYSAYETESGQFFLVDVPRRDSETLLNIVKSKVVPGSVVMSDCWGSSELMCMEALSELRDLYDLRDVSLWDDMDREQLVWKEVRGTVPRYGTPEHHFVSHLVEFFWKRSYPDFKDRFHSFFSLIGSLFDPEEALKNSGSYSSRCGNRNKKRIKLDRVDSSSFLQLSANANDFTI